MVVIPEGRSHSIKGSVDGLGTDGWPIRGCMGGAESSIMVGGSKGTHDAVLDPWFKAGEEWIVVELDILEEGEIVGPVQSLLLIGSNGDSMGLGSLSSQVSSCEHSSGSSG